MALELGLVNGAREPLAVEDAGEVEQGPCHCGDGDAEVDSDVLAEERARVVDAYSAMTALGGGSDLNRCSPARVDLPQHSSRAMTQHGFGAARQNRRHRTGERRR